MDKDKKQVVSYSMYKQLLEERNYYRGVAKAYRNVLALMGYDVSAVKEYEPKQSTTTSARIINMNRHG